MTVVSGTVILWPPKDLAVMPLFLKEGTKKPRTVV
jgi:hypothetical protein